MSGLAELLERCKAATGPDRELDARLFMFDRGFTRIEQDLDSTGPRYYAWSGDKYQGEITSQNRPIYTASIDASLALTERVLPGWEWLKKSPKVISVYRPLTEQEDAAKVWAKHYDGAGATLPLAILCATLSALIAKGEQP